MASGVTFVVNPASANGSTGKRWPEIAHRAAELGLTGDSLLSERPGHAVELARAQPRRERGSSSRWAATEP